MLKKYVMIKLLFTASLLFVFCIPALADTIRMKDGSVIKGKIIDFKDQQFTVAIGDDSRGRKRQITVYADEIESITFDAVNPVPAITTPTTAEIKPTVTPNQSSGVKINPPAEKPIETVKPPVTRPASKGNFVVVSNSVKVLADNTANGWTNSGFVVRRGQRVRVTAKGNISLGSGRYAKPDGDSSYADKDKLVSQKPTGGLIAVIGDDNDEFIFVGSSVEFVAQRDGTLFLGINEGNLDDNAGAFDVTVEAEVDTPDTPQD
jgi:hypothetical protein